MLHTAEASVHLQDAGIPWILSTAVSAKPITASLMLDVWPCLMGLMVQSEGLSTPQHLNYGNKKYFNNSEFRL
jgi:hypothetical protein